MQKLTKTVATLALLGLAASGAHAQVIISQVYGGGGSSQTSPLPSFKEDYVELYNTGTTAVDLTGFSIQYASTAGTFPVPGTATSLYFRLLPVRQQSRQVNTSWFALVPHQPLQELI